MFLVELAKCIRDRLMQLQIPCFSFHNNKASAFLVSINDDMKQRKRLELPPVSDNTFALQYGREKFSSRKQDV